MQPDHAIVIVGILLFISFSIPVISSLWKIFAVRQALELQIQESHLALSERITSNSHRLELLEKDGKYLIDQQALAINGLREMVGHVRSRSAHEEERLRDRIADLEGFLAKTAAFELRRNRPD